VPSTARDARSCRATAVAARVALAALVALVASLAACGSSATAGPRPWRAAHPDPAGFTFTDAEGLCAITVQYPDAAPGEIDDNGVAYIQRSRSAQPASPTGSQVARSGDWTLRRADATTLLLVTAGGTYTYRSGSKCGSNAAPPS
jgi:hypothetical protein